jgi:tetratricopeptide (TPR) repeat protein
MDSESNSVRTAFYMGFYEEALKEAQEMKSSNNENVDVFYFRAMLEKHPNQVVRSIPARASTSLQAIKHLATYRTSSREGKDLVLETLTQWLADAAMSENATLQLVAAEIYCHEENYRAALALVNGDRENLDKMAMAVHILLKWDRADLAQKVVATMMGVEDDDCLTVLAQANVAAATGEESKLNQAAASLEELIERHGPSVVAYNAMAAVNLSSRKFPQAFNYLKNARDTAKRQNMVTPAETLINTIVCLQHMNPGQLGSRLSKVDLISRVQTELETTHPNHPWFTTQRENAEMFTKCAASYH